jgi:hypothetical protein
MATLSIEWAKQQALLRPQKDVKPLSVVITPFDAFRRHSTGVARAFGNLTLRNGNTPPLHALAMISPFLRVAPGVLGLHDGIVDRGKSRSIKDIGGLHIANLKISSSAFTLLGCGLAIPYRTIKIIQGFAPVAPTAGFVADNILRAGGSAGFALSAFASILSNFKKGWDAIGLYSELKVHAQQSDFSADATYRQRLVCLKKRIGNPAEKAKLTRIIGKDLVHDVEKARNSDLPKVKTLVDAIEQKALKQSVLVTTLIILGALGIVGLVLTNLYIVGPAAIVATLFYLFVTTARAVMDIYQMSQAPQEVAPHSKGWLIFSSVVMCGFTALSLALAGMSGAIVPVVLISLFTSLFYLLAQAYYLKKIEDQNKPKKT